MSVLRKGQIVRLTDAGARANTDMIGLTGPVVQIGDDRSSAAVAFGPVLVTWVRAAWLEPVE